MFSLTLPFSDEFLIWNMQPMNKRGSRYLHCQFESYISYTVS